MRELKYIIGGSLMGFVIMVGLAFGLLLVLRSHEIYLGILWLPIGMFAGYIGAIVGQMVGMILLGDR